MYFENPTPGPMGDHRFDTQQVSSLHPQNHVTLSRLQMCPRKTCSETIRHRWYQAGSKYWFPGFGFDSGPNLQPCIGILLMAEILHRLSFQPSQLVIFTGFLAKGWDSDAAMVGTCMYQNPYKSNWVCY